jgi:YesN/AraC family two-component response regulator
MLSSYIFLVALAVFIVSSVLFFYFSSNTSKEISRMMQAMLKQTSMASALMQNQMYYVSNQLLNDPAVLNFLDADAEGGDHPLADYKVYLTLKKINAAFPFLQYIGLYNKENDHYVNTLGIPYDSDRQLLEALKEGQLTASKQMTARQITNGSQTYRLISLVFYPTLNFGKPPGGALIINLDEAQLRDTIQQFSQQSKASVFVLNAQGSVISHSLPDMFHVSMTDQAYVRRILSESGDGFFTASADGVKQLVTYVYSEELDWYFVSTIPLADVIPNTYKLISSTLLIASGIILLGTLLSLWIASNMHSPIRSLIGRMQESNKGDSVAPNVNEFDVVSQIHNRLLDHESGMRHELASTAPLLQQKALMHLMKKTFDDMPSLNRYLNESKLQLSCRCYRVAVISIDHVKQFLTASSLKNQALTRFAIANIATELLERHFTVHPVMMEADEIAILAGSEEQLVMDDFILTLKEIQDAVRQYYKVTISVSLGGWTDTNNISQSYEEAKRLAKLRLFFGHESIIDESMRAKTADGDYKYPAAIEKSLLEAIKLNDRAAIHAQSRRFVQALGRMEYSHALTYSHQMLLSILKEFEGTVIHLGKESEHFYLRLVKLSELETLEQIGEELSDYCLSICELLIQKQSIRMSDNLEKTRDFIAQHYTDPNLTIESAAERLHISPSYLRKQFKAYYSISFGDMLRNIRLDHACALLQESDLSMAEICDRVGIANANYFYTLFKKRYGVSPALYREQKRG